jgi:AraC-like DNA-binding protein
MYRKYNDEIGKDKTKMNHISIMNTENPLRQIEVTHHDYVARKGHWKKTRICRDNIKINFFIGGDISVFINDTCYRPTCGDICVLPPAQIHCGLVESESHLDYFQLDVGVQAFDHICGGKELLTGLISCIDGRFFLRPESKENGQLSQLFYSLESLVMQNNKVLAFAYTIEILQLIQKCYGHSSGISSVALSKTTKRVIDHLKAHYQEKITVSQLSEMFGSSAAHLSAVFKKEIGMSIHTYLTEYRVMRSAEYLKDHSIADTCYLCGFYDSSHFIAAFKKRFNCTPAVYKKQFTYENKLKHL